MSIDSLKAALPAYAKDLKLNLSGVLNAASLSEQQVWGSALAAAIAARNPQVTAAVEAEARAHLSEEALTAAKTAAALMAMNNVYYRFLSLTSEAAYAQLPAGLRMNALGRPGVEALDFELFSLSVSVVNACAKCVDAHERTVREKGAGREAVQAVVRVAAVIHAVAVTLEGEAATAGEARAAA